ncbi:hypothetical protein TGP89_418680 [Toxoplasma gondii p89]|uniref:Uncharacterized protein n=1 Tax=Toxoplasma gondii p89 TaxID=943119 RepID=A0A086KZA8_TOXGO|nr:hypothetical protein TGP89_418680 [Toxoplasma gondii p89]
MWRVSTVFARPLRTPTLSASPNSTGDKGEFPNSRVRDKRLTCACDQFSRYQRGLFRTSPGVFVQKMVVCLSPGCQAAAGKGRLPNL